MRALIVDDSRLTRGQVRGLLEHQGFECEEASNATRGLEILHSGRLFDVALVDWYMPGISGLDMVRRLRLEGFEQLKVMMVTCESENNAIVRALQAGADEYLMKPFDSEALTEKLALMGVELQNGA